MRAPLAMALVAASLLGVAAVANAHGVAEGDAGFLEGNDGLAIGLRHGWYFRNVGDEPVTITLQTWGYYEVVGLLG